MSADREAVAHVRFYAGLNHFLPPAARQRTLAYTLNGPVSVKHIIEALGVPHTDVALILRNGHPITFEQGVTAGDRIAVYPHFTTLDISSAPPLRPPLSRPIRFVLDVHLGTLTTYLRLLGFDALYRHDYDDAELADISAREERVLLTRDRRLLMRKQIIYGFCLHSHNSRRQLLAVLERYNLYGDITPWQRCLRCNGRLQSVPKEAILDRLEPLTKIYYNEFQQCQACQQVYWKGSHFSALQAFVERMQRRATPA